MYSLSCVYSGKQIHTTEAQLVYPHYRRPWTERALQSHPVVIVTASD